MKKKEKIHIITPSGKEIKLGFLSPCKNGIVVGTAQVEDDDTSHLTIIAKEDFLSSHITPQEHPENRRYFPRMKKSQIVDRFQTMLEHEMISPLSTEHMSEKVFYATRKFENWFNTIKTILFQKRVTSKEIIHIINIKELLEMAPRLAEEIGKNPSAFFGLCTANEILKDESKTVGINNSGLMLIPHEDQLYQVNLFMLSNFKFNPTLEPQEISNPLAEIYQSLGIPQYMKEIEKKKILQKLFSKNTE